MEEADPDVIYISSDSDGDSDDLRLNDDSDLDINDDFPIELLDDDDDVQVDLDDDEDDGQVDLDDDEIDLNDDALVQELTKEEWEDAIARKLNLRTPSASPPAAPLPHEPVLKSFTVDNFTIKPGMTLELKPRSSTGTELNEFLRVHSIFKQHGKAMLRGEILHRVKTLHGMLPKKTNELAAIRKCNREDSRSEIQQSLVDVAVGLASVERKVVFTNAIFPASSFREQTNLTEQNKDIIRDSGVLVCRWKYVTVSEHPKSKRIEEQKLERLSEQEADSGYAVSDAVLRRWTRSANDGNTIDLTRDQALGHFRESMRNYRDKKTGSTKANAITVDGDEDVVPHDYNGRTMASLSRSNARSVTKNPNSARRLDASEAATASPAEPYTFADCFCGGGGVSCGASLAGFRLKWSFDMDKDACATYRKDDEANEASLFATHSLIKAVMPRVVTIEETSGIRTHHPMFFHALIMQLTSLEYSVRWKTMNFAEHGLAQARKRVIMIACRAGEPLPPFPAPTHGPGLKPFTTIRQATAAVRPGMPNHNPEQCARKNEPGYDPNQPLRRCITTSGGDDNCHWSGKRAFSLRELASLQGFPTDHVFCGRPTSVRKQIGNAVPPLVYRAICKEITRTLRATDASPGTRGNEHDPIEVD
ncbi:hypothetical protein MBLNU459_g1771t2 [Dothideomycetes sp. NU459]